MSFFFLNAGACISKPSLISLLEHGKEPWEVKGQVTRSPVQGENSRSRLKNLCKEWLHHLQRSLPGLKLPETLPKPEDPGCELKFPCLAWIPFSSRLSLLLSSCLGSKSLCTKENVLVSLWVLWWSSLTKAALKGTVFILAVVPHCSPSLWGIHIGTTLKQLVTDSGSMLACYEVSFLYSDTVLLFSKQTS